MDEKRRPGGTYGFDRTIRWADGRTDRTSWSEQLTSEEATERMGPLPPRLEVPELWWSREHGVIEQQTREGSAFYGEYRPVGTVRWMIELPTDAVRLVADPAWAQDGLSVDV